MILRYWETIRHLRPQQVLARVRLRASARARLAWPHTTARIYRRRAQRAALTIVGGLLDREAASQILEQRALSSEGVASEFWQGRFTFLNATADIGWPPDWSAPGQSQLWRYHLHYFEVLTQSDSFPREAANALIESWIGAHALHGRSGTRDAWHPYVVSLRMVNWMLYLSAEGGTVPHRVQRSLIEQALFLERNLETDVGGNHLLKNLKAMVFAGCFWSGTGAASWRRTYSLQFVEELDRQLLADGGHYERAPMYHCQVMSDAIEVARVLAAHRLPVVDRLAASIAQMDRHLESVTHPDGGIALFNDSAFGMAPAPGLLHRSVPASKRGKSDTSAPHPTIAARASGYVALPEANPARFLIADVGAVCPDDLPAHAHADLLSFELSVDGRRMLVDSGVGEYSTGSWRAYYRSTRAHNTVMVDSCEQSDCWASFRVGRRASPANVSVQRDQRSLGLEAEHTGYDHLPSAVRHRRRFKWSDDDFWVVDDKLVGVGSHQWSSFCHLHPDAIVIAEGSDWIRVARETTVLDICWYGFSSARQVRGQQGDLQGWYAERFGRAVPATVLILDGVGAVPARFGYALIPQKSLDSPAASVSVSAEGAVCVRVGGREFRA